MAILISSKKRQKLRLGLFKKIPTDIKFKRGQVFFFLKKKKKPTDIKFERGHVRYWAFKKPLKHFIYKVIIYGYIK